MTEAAAGGTDTETTVLASLTLSGNIENLVYTGTGNFAGTGNTLANAITGGAGNDTLNGGTGADIMTGLGGDDTYVVDNNGDVVVEAAGGGTDTVLTTLTNYALGANVENVTFTGAGNDTLTDGLNTFGVDKLIGGAGNDTYNVSNVGDVIVEVAVGGTDTVRTVLGSYTLDANIENLTYAGAGTFFGTGNVSANTINGGGGADVLDGGANTAGVDTLVGGAGNDTYLIRNLGDVITEGAGAGIDMANVFVNTYTLGANVENMTFLGTGAFTGTGNTLANVLTGSAGADTLNGGAGNDTLIGGAGADTLTGGTGADTFFLTRGDANGDLIADFTRTQADKIQLSGYGAAATAANPLGATVVKTVVGTAATPTSYAVLVGGVTQDTFKLTGNMTLTAGTDYNFV